MEWNALVLGTWQGIYGYGNYMRALVVKCLHSWLAKTGSPITRGTDTDTIPAAAFLSPL